MQRSSKDQAGVWFGSFVSHRWVYQSLWLDLCCLKYQAAPMTLRCAPAHHLFLFKCDNGNREHVGNQTVCGSGVNTGGALDHGGGASLNEVHGACLSAVGDKWCLPFAYRRQLFYFQLNSIFAPSLSALPLPPYLALFPLLSLSPPPPSLVDLVNHTAFRALLLKLLC